MDAKKDRKSLGGAINVTLTLVYRSIKHPYKVQEDVVAQVDKLSFQSKFLTLEEIQMKNYLQQESNSFIRRDITNSKILLKETYGHCLLDNSD